MRIVIAEDSAVIRAGLAEILTDCGHVVCAAVGDAAALRAAVAEHRPDVTVVDVRMPPGYTDEGLRAATAIRRDYPDIGVLVFSQYIETRHAADLLAAAPGGAAGVGYLLKDRVADVAEFVDALSRVASGGTALDPQVVTEMMRGQPSRRRHRRAHRPGTRRARADGRGPLQRRHRGGPRHLRAGGGEARLQHLQQARGSPRRMLCTAGCEPFSATWSPDFSPLPGHRASRTPGLTGWHGGSGGCRPRASRYDHAPSRLVCVRELTRRLKGRRHHDSIRHLGELQRQRQADSRHHSPGRRRRPGWRGHRAPPPRSPSPAGLHAYRFPCSRAGGWRGSRSSPAWRAYGAQVARRAHRQGPARRSHRARGP